MLRLAIAGCNGRMGKVLVQTASQDKEVRITAATLSHHHPLLNTDVGAIAGIAPLHFKPVEDLSKLIDKFDVLIDFTTPDATALHMKWCHQHQKKMVIGTTGLSFEQKNYLKEISQDIAIAFSPNMSIGINLCFKLLQQAAKVVGENADIEIIEAHHRNKVDAPSGTALKMGEVISEALNHQLEEVAIYGRHGMLEKRDRKTIGFSTIRAGDIAGEHTVIFALEGERIELTHRASNRSTFAHGAILAAKWLANKTVGLYSMEEVLFAGRE